MSQVPGTMRAIALNEFGGIDKLTLKEVPVPELAENEVLIAVEAAGVGEWDPFEREGGFAGLTGSPPAFPYIPGSEGAGTVAAVGRGVTKFKPGDEVYASGFLNPKGGFYAEYAAVDAGLVCFVPRHIAIQDAAVMSGVGLTALRGLDDTLHLREGETLAVHGASGGVGHLAVQIAKHRGARILAIASGEDGVALAEKLGADAVVDGHRDDVGAAVRNFAPDGLDVALLTAGGDAANDILRSLHTGGRAAYPNGVEPAPQAPSGIQLASYNGDPDPDILHRFHEQVESGPFEVQVDGTFPLAEAAEAHQALEKHYVGKLALRVSGT